MKCPKCGYNSFESYDVCIKCSNDLTVHKATYGLKPIVLQKEVRAAMAAALMTETVSVAAPVPPVQTDDMFSFDLPDEEPAAAAKQEAVENDIFSFDDKTAAPPSELFNAFSFDSDESAETNKQEEDPFASLLESTQHTDTVSQASPQKMPSTPTQDNETGEFELNSFSWDDTTEISEADNKKPVDDFKSLFGEIDATVKK